MHRVEYVLYHKSFKKLKLFGIFFSLVIADSDALFAAVKPPQKDIGELW
jgi:hypothetical protein